MRASGKGVGGPPEVLASQPGRKDGSIKRVITAVARNVQIPESVKIQE